MKDISVFRSSQSPASVSRVELGLRRPLNPSINGISKLAQEYLMMLLKTPGFDIFNRRNGGGIRTLNGFDSQEELESSVRAAILKAKRDVMSSQRISGLPSDERLSNVDLVKITPLGDGRVNADIRIISESSKSAYVNVVA